MPALENMCDFLLEHGIQAEMKAQLSDLARFSAASACVQGISKHGLLCCAVQNHRDSAVSCGLNGLSEWGNEIQTHEKVTMQIPVILTEMYV